MDYVNQYRKRNLETRVGLSWLSNIQGARIETVILLKDI